MRYSAVCRGIFLARPNRFIAEVEMEGRVEICHVKNTGRCRELLLPGAVVILAVAENPQRKTRYDLVAVYKGDMLVNMDSQAPNKAAAEYLALRFPEAELIRPEYAHGNSRLDFYIRVGAREIFVEVKGCTLEREGVALFPDAPTERGAKHLRELGNLARKGYEAYVLFVIQMRGPAYFMPNDAMDPAFGHALRQAAAQGMGIWAVDCLVEEGGFVCDREIPVHLPWRILFIPGYIKRGCRANAPQPLFHANMRLVNRPQFP